MLKKCTLATIKKLVEDDRELLLREDEKGCIALYQAVYYASREVIQYLVESMKTVLSDGAQPPSSMPGANILQMVCECKCPLWIVKE